MDNLARAKPFSDSPAGSAGGELTAFGSPVDDASESGGPVGAYRLIYVLQGSHMRVVGPSKAMLIISLESDTPCR